jgi:ubiquinone/menaquinone biosynthesis C-methylase UbiE
MPVHYVRRIPARYDTIGVDYTRHRRPDPRVAAQIHAALGDAARIVDVGAGAGSYEPSDRVVVAIDPSEVMLGQHRGARRVQGVAEHLPFPDGAFDAALAVFTVHHWTDPDGGLAELQRVARRQVVLTFDHVLERAYWLNDYWPVTAQYDGEWMATIEAVTVPLRTDHVEVIPVPHDCEDGFMAAYWRRPERYLDPAVRANISGLALLPPEEAEAGARRLAADLESGRWHERYGHLLDLDELDAGYRLVVAG